MALMITTKKPIVENRSRPVSAMRTGRANRFTSTRTAAQDRKPTMPAPRSAMMGAEFGPNGNGCPTEMIPRKRAITKRMRASSTTSTMKRRIRSSSAIRADDAATARTPHCGPSAARATHLGEISRGRRRGAARSAEGAAPARRRARFDLTDPPVLDARGVEGIADDRDRVGRDRSEETAGRLRIERQRDALRTDSRAGAQRRTDEAAVVRRPARLDASRRRLEGGGEGGQGGGLEREERARRPGHLEPVAEQPEARDIGRRANAVRDEHVRGGRVQPAHPVDRGREVGIPDATLALARHQKTRPERLRQDDAVARDRATPT